jgi:hypothetical protein
MAIPLTYGEPVPDDSPSKVIVVAPGSDVQVPARPQLPPPKSTEIIVALSGRSVPIKSNPNAFLVELIGMLP